MRKRIVIMILLIISMLCTSCTRIRELNELGIVMAVALDLEDNKIILTNEVALPSAMEPGSPLKNKVIYVQSTGDTIFDAYRNATLEFDRKLFVSHNMIVIFGEEFAKRGIGDYIVDFLNDSEPRETAYMLVAKGKKAYELLGINGGTSSTSGEYLKNLIENYKHSSKTRSITISEYLKYFFERKTPVLGVIQEEEEIRINKKSMQEQNDKLTLNVMGGAVFKKDELQGYYSGDEMIGFNFMVNNIKGGLIVFETPDKASDEGKHIASKGKFTTMEVVSSKTKKDVEIADGQIHLTINIKLKGSLGEETKGLRTTELSVKNDIEKACSDKIEKHIKMVMEKAQKEFKIDNFDIKNLIYIKYPEFWKEISDDWDEEIFPAISYSVHVETNMIRTGLINTPPNIERGREE